MAAHQNPRALIDHLCQAFSSGRLRHPEFKLLKGQEYDNHYTGQGMENPGDPMENHFKFQASILVCEKLFRQGRFSAEGTASRFRLSMVHMIWGSNLISDNHSGPEDIHTALRITARLCGKAFTGNLEDLVEGSLEYLEIEEYLRRTMRNHDKAAVYEYYDSIFQHALAALHIFTEVRTHGRLTEQIISDTYKILACCRGGSAEYRTTQASCFLHPYMEPQRIPKSMLCMAVHMDNEIRTVSNQGSIDPIILAVKYSHSFDYIHPFATGNGRLARLILNALLLRYGGALALFGQNKEQQDQYRNVSKLCTMNQCYAFPADPWPEDAPSRMRPHNTLCNLTVSYALKWVEANFKALCLAEPLPQIEVKAEEGRSEGWSEG
ncbi:hypothetical protein ACHAPT_009702 [Fusarium lateritium]